MVGLSARLLLAHWPALMAWYLAGVLANYVIVQVAGWVGAYTALGGLMIMPLAILARLVGFVAMMLVLRDGMTHLAALAPAPATPAERRRRFLDALLAGVLPFFAFYAAWGLLREDMAAYTARALEIQTENRFASILTGAVIDTSGTVDTLQWEPLTIALIVVAFAGRWAWQRYRAKLPRAVALVAVYLETVWVFLTVYLISDLFGAVSAWVQTRQAMQWVADARAWVGEFFVPVAWIWDGVIWLLGEAGGIILLPVAWLTIAGVVYGQAIAAARPEVPLGRAAVLRDRYRRIPQRVRRRLGDLGGQLVARFRPIGGALVLMWRAGPVLIAGYVLVYAVVVALEGLLQVVTTRLIGPHDFAGFWTVVAAFVFVPVALIVEPIRIALVGAAYDRVLARLSPAETVAVVAEAEAAAEGPGADGVASAQREPEEVGLGADHLQVDRERP